MPQKLSPRGRGKKGRDAILRLFHGVPVRDAKHPLRVVPLARDIRGAKTKDPQNCVLARACRRMFRTSTILFWRSVAYVELPDERGKPHVERFVLSQHMRENIALFDRTGKADPAGYTLNPPAIGQTLEHKRRYQAEWASKAQPKRNKRIHVSGNFEVRDGHGQVKFECKPA